MNLLLLKKNLSFKPLSSNPTLLHILHKFSSLASATRIPSPKSNFITNYLIKSCGFSPQKAATASKPIATLTSAERPDSVRHFLKHLGYEDAHIRSIISSHPSILFADVDKTMKPHLQALRGIVHVSDSKLRRMIVSTPHLLTNPRTLPRLEFWKKYVDGDMKKLCLAVTRTKGLINSDIIKSVAPKIALLRDHGLSEENIRLMLTRSNRVLAMSIPSLELLLKRVQELGFQRGSSMFAYGLSTLSNFGLDTFKAKVGVFKSYGWSEKEIAAAFKTYPFFLGLSKENIQKKMEFLVGRVGCLQSYIASHPILLGLSLEKRLMPRYHVISCLKMNKSISREWNLCTIMLYSDNIFLEKFILRYKELEPMLLETYAAACEGRATP